MTNPAPPPHRTQIPNIVDDLGLDPYERALYVHYKRVCGENQGAYCFEATRTTAGKVKMSTGQVSLARKSLAERGLIIVQAESRPVVVTVVNIWEINTSFYKLEYRPDVTDWTIEQVKIWLHDMSTDVHTVNVSSHNDIDTRSPSEHPPIDMSSDVHTVKQRSKDSSTTTKEGMNQIGDLCKEHFSDPAVEPYRTQLLETINRYSAVKVLWAIQTALSPDRQNGKAKSWGYVLGILEKDERRSSNQQALAARPRSKDKSPPISEAYRQLLEEDKTQVYNPLDRS